MKLFSVLIFGIASLSGIGGLPVAGSTTTSSVSSSPPHAQDGHIELKATVTFPAESSTESDAHRESVQEAVKIILDLAATKLFGNEKSVAITVSGWKGFPKRMRVSQSQILYYPFKVAFSKDSHPPSKLETGNYRGRIVAQNFDIGFEKYKDAAVNGRIVSPTKTMVMNIKHGQIAKVPIRVSNNEYAPKVDSTVAELATYQSPSSSSSSPNLNPRTSTYIHRMSISFQGTSYHWETLEEIARAKDVIQAMIVEAWKKLDVEPVYSQNSGRLESVLLPELVYDGTPGDWTYNMILEVKLKGPKHRSRGIYEWTEAGKGGY
ncbi:hypothetical protein F5876DRAFT_82321 [Lentinula aff. lateritia]|uniref:Uncharacterized protein n=1 Tax=Lentinula aff. lateritia TaxID=2804960 RepID=A0ACC1TK73_9AGAR|nr:hypothetical protein F5876DRAFT_82321 [Lentinula aff. lateritia]